jgi:hypothetical protein
LCDVACVSTYLALCPSGDCADALLCALPHRGRRPLRHQGQAFDHIMVETTKGSVYTSDISKPWIETTLLPSLFVTKTCCHGQGNDRKRCDYDGARSTRCCLSRTAGRGCGRARRPSRCPRENCHCSFR